MTTFDWTVDEHGPHLVAVLRLPANCMAYVVVDDVSLGPAIGGVRLGPAVTTAEVARLARAMTLKNAAAMLPHGGGKAGIRTPEDFDPAHREQVIRGFADGIRQLDEYIPGPDMGTDEIAMAWIHDEIGRSVGLPALIGGIPLDEIGATGFGLAACADALVEAGRLTLNGARVAIQGFGAVGRHAAVFLTERGAQIVAVSDTSATAFDPDGIDVAAMVAFKAGHRISEYSAAKILDRDAVIGLDCDVLIPAAQPDVITASNAALVSASVVLPGANIAVTDEAEASLHERGVLCLPDFIANAGGVICAAVEYRRGSRTQAFAEIAERIRANTAELLDRIATSGDLPRVEAERMARTRINHAAGLRRRF
jgi:glutamate dehydrogenase/leucine dehydrogenase